MICYQGIWKKGHSMKIDDLLDKARRLARQNPSYMVRYADGTTEKVSGHDAIVLAIKCSCGLVKEIEDVTPIDGVSGADGLANAILNAKENT